jgi:death-on-curing family protein
MTKTILFVRQKEILQLIKQALLNENKEDLPLLVEFAQLGLGEKLYHSLCAMIKEGFSAVKKLKTLTARHQEVNPGTYTGLIHHLVFYQWRRERENNTISLLQMWAEVGCGLVRGHYFTNGNKRTALLVMLTFIWACGFSLKSDSNQEIFLLKWEKLLIDVATAESEELATELIKEKILLELCLTNNEKSN